MSHYSLIYVEIDSTEVNSCRINLYTFQKAVLLNLLLKHLIHPNEYGFLLARLLKLGLVNAWLIKSDLPY